VAVKEYIIGLFSKKTLAGKNLWVSGEENKRKMGENVPGTFNFGD